MLGFKKNKKSTESVARLPGNGEAQIIPKEESAEKNLVSSEKVSNLKSTAQDKGTFFTKLKSGLGKTRQGFTRGLGDLLLGRKEIDDELLEDIETQLLLADVGVDATRKIIHSITEQVARKELLFADALYDKLKDELFAILQNNQNKMLDKTPAQGMPYVILVVGVNGVGKTTTIGKLAKLLQGQGKQVMLAAGDTFRAAAVEQLQIWGERNAVPVVAQHTGADSASVIFDALQSARSKGINVLIADTAGRLHNKNNLMDELSKVKRVLQKLDPEAPHEVMLVIDASTGQNALNQVKQFNEAVHVDSLVVTKLDGTAKGGIVFAIADQCQVPIKYIGVGEQIDDLRPFDQQQFVQALFEQD